MELGEACSGLWTFRITWYGIIKDETNEARNKHASLEEDKQDLIQDLGSCVEGLCILSDPLRHHLQD